MARSRDRDSDRDRDRDRDRGRSDRDKDRDRDRDRGKDRDRDRRRSRSRSKDRRRSKSRSPEHKPRRNKKNWDNIGGVELLRDPALANDPQAAAALALQQQQLLGLLPQQQIGSKKQRELYIGNLAVGMVTEYMLKELFQNLISSVPAFDPTRGPAVAHVQMNGQGGFAFVEMRDEVIAVTAMRFNGIELCGRPLRIGRPSGYVQPISGDPPPLDVPEDMLNRLGVGGFPISMTINPAMAKAATSAPVFVPTPVAAIPNITSPTKLLCLANMCSHSVLADDAEYAEVKTEIAEECGQYGGVQMVTMPRTGPHAGKAFVLYDDTSAAEKAFKVMDGRFFDGSTVKCSYMPLDQMPS